ncbi:hypothetical protein QQP08_010485 [Theobroma cacao]|nr:hypothetical protein QQP08_010485 [Theobroma cacao]
MADLEQQRTSSMGQKSMYMVFCFDEGPIRYTLYSFTNINLTHTPRKQSPRSIAMLQMSSDKFPPGMGFVALGSKLYCIGGQLQKGEQKFSSKKVFVLDLNTIETCHKEKRSPLVEEVADMHEGKCYPYVFEMQGKIYVLDGYRNIDAAEGLAIGSFEVFDPDVGQWGVLPKYYQGDLSEYIRSFVFGHAAVGDRVFFRSDCIDCRCRLSSFDTKNRQWFYDNRCCWVSDEEKKEMPGYISAWNDAFKEHAVVGSSFIVNDTLYALQNGCIGAYHISNNEDDRYIPCDVVRGIETKLPSKLVKDTYSGPFHSSIFVPEAGLVHLGDEKFCLVTGATYRNDYAIVKKEIVFLTFQTIKQKSSKADQVFWWADIYDSRAVEGIDALLGMVLYTFVA